MGPVRIWTGSEHLVHVSNEAEEVLHVDALKINVSSRLNHFNDPGTVKARGLPEVRRRSKQDFKELQVQALPAGLG